MTADEIMKCEIPVGRYSHGLYILREDLEDSLKEKELDMEFAIQSSCSSFEALYHLATDRPLGDKELCAEMYRQEGRDSLAETKASTLADCIKIIYATPLPLERGELIASLRALADSPKEPADEGN